WGPRPWRQQWGNAPAYRYQRGNWAPPAYNEYYGNQGYGNQYYGNTGASYQISSLMQARYYAQLKYNAARARGDSNGAQHFMNEIQHLTGQIAALRAQGGGNVNYNYVPQSPYGYSNYGYPYGSGGTTGA